MLMVNEAFGKAFRISWARRMFSSYSKWTLFPKTWVIYEIYFLVSDKMEGNKELILKPFWQDFLDISTILWKSNAIMKRHILY